MSLLERTPDNTAIEAQIRPHLLFGGMGLPMGMLLGSLPQVEPSSIPPGAWGWQEFEEVGAYGVVGRYKVMRYEVTPVMRILEGDFVKIMHISFLGQHEYDNGRFSGTVTAPGVEGTLKNVTVAREEPVAAEVAAALRAQAPDAQTRAAGVSVYRERDGALVLPGFMAASLAGAPARQAAAVGDGAGRS